MDIAGGLRDEAVWLKSQYGLTGSTEAGSERVEWLVKSCVDFLQQSRNKDYGAWMRRNNRVRLIRRGPKSYRRKDVNKALRDLVALTISDIGANRSQPEIPWHWRERKIVCDACGEGFKVRPRGSKACGRKCERALKANQGVLVP